MNEETTEAPVVELNMMGSKPKEGTAAVGAPVNAPQRAWFDDEEGGWNCVVKHDGQIFKGRELSDEDCKAFQRDVEANARALKAVAREQEDAGDEITDEQRKKLEQDTAWLLDEQIALYDGVLQKTLTSWSLPRPYSPDLIRKLGKGDRRKIAGLIAQRSMMGADESEFLSKPSRR